MPLTVTIFILGLLGGAPDAFAAPAESGSTDPEADATDAAAVDRPPVQTPKSTDDEGNPDATVAPETEETAADETAPANEAPADPPPAAPDETDLSGLLDAPEEPSTPRRPAPSAADDGERGVSKDEKLARYYNELYRPADNRGNLHAGGRLIFASFGGSQDALSGRMGGANIDIGHQFNWIGYGLSLAAYGGQAYAGPGGNARVNGLFGGGPSLTLGRLALLRQGYMAVDVGYDFLFGPASATAFATEQGQTFAPDPLAPHGPRLRLDLGLLIFQTIQRPMRHGVGLTLGYQGLVGDLMGSDLPYTNVMTIGLSYWGG